MKVKVYVVTKNINSIFEGTWLGSCLTVFVMHYINSKLNIYFYFHMHFSDYKVLGTTFITKIKEF